MFLTPKLKLKLLLGGLATLILLLLATPYLIVTGTNFLSKETIQAIFLLLEFFGATFILNEFNRLRIIIQEKKATEEKLNKLEQNIEKLSYFYPAHSGTKGIILAGGTATRLFPLTATTSKQLLPIYDKQMIFYPLNTLIKAGIREILIIVSPENSGQFLNLLGSIFKNRGVNLYFEVQKNPRGLADAFLLGKNFIGQDNVVLALGDNIFEDDISSAVTDFQSGARIFAKKVSDPERFGVIKFDENFKAIEIVEKPKKWISDYAIPGIYIFDKEVSRIAQNLTPSARGELEITDIHNHYLRQGKLEVRIIEGEWLDAGTFDSLLEAGRIVKEKNIAANFHPIIQKAINDFNQELKYRSKKILEASNDYNQLIKK